MDMIAFLDKFPLWSVLPITIGLALLSVEAGYRIAGYRQQRGGDEKESSVGGMVGATLGLLAFMLAFTFSMAASRFEARRQVLLSEVNAIGTCYLRAGLLTEPMRTDARNLLREYVDARLEAVQPGKLEQGMVKSEELHKRLWSVATLQAEKERTVITSLFITSLNEVIDLHTTRITLGLRSRVPGIIWIVLYLLAILAMVLHGYHAGLTKSKRSIAVVVMAIGFSLVLYLIADLDRPGQGLLKVSQQTMIDLQKSM
jgi:hypothetical protein